MIAVEPQDLIDEAYGLLSRLGDGAMSATAYDTAWVSRLRPSQGSDEPLFPATIDWMLANQQADGSWGSELPFAHDRLICTLAAIVALAESRDRPAAQEAIRRAVLYLLRERPDLRSDPADTVAFELLLPELMRQARDLDLRLPYDDWAHVEATRSDKLSRIPPIAIYGGPTTLTTSLEHLGDRLLPSLATRCQSPNGSFGCSPSATAYALGAQWDPKAEAYVRHVASLSPDGGMVFLQPFEIFETAWVLYYLRDMKLEAEVLRPHLWRLLDGWQPTGVSWTRESAVTDADDTAVVVTILGDHGYRLDSTVFRLYEAEDHFYCFAFERDASVGANAHILEALYRYPAGAESQGWIQKLLRYLGSAQVDGRYWMDKWHASPLYATDQATRALAPVAPERTRAATRWLLETQHSDGSWGLAGGNSEETALALGSLLTAAEFDPSPPEGLREAAQRAAAYLAQRVREEDGPALWRGKALYRPHNIVRAIVLSALYRWATGMNHVEHTGS